MIRMGAAQFESLRAKGFKMVEGRQVKGGHNPAPTTPAPPAPRRMGLPFPGRHKYSAQRTEVDGVKFASKSEAARYHWLKTEQAAGRLIFFLMQTRIDIPGSYYRLDFLEFWANGDIVWMDIKGFETEGFKIKRRAVEALYPFKITTARQRGRGDAKTWEYA